MATTLNQALETITDKGGARASVRKHLAAVGINRWSDISRTRLYDYRDHLTEVLKGSTPKTILARTSAMFERFSDEVKLPDGWRDILSAKGDTTVRTYLTPEELELFAAVPTRGEREEVVKYECLLEAYTGARVSDITALTIENIQGTTLSYVSKKTHKRANIPVGERVYGWIERAQALRAFSPDIRATRNAVISRLCQRAGIDAPVYVRAGGEDKRGPKYLYITSHSFRVSFVTNLHIAGLDLLTISRMAGHSSVTMTERYCAVTTPKLTAGAEGYLGV